MSELDMNGLLLAAYDAIENLAEAIHKQEDKPAELPTGALSDADRKRLLSHLRTVDKACVMRHMPRDVNGAMVDMFMILNSLTPAKGKVGGLKYDRVLFDEPFPRLHVEPENTSCPPRDYDLFAPPTLDHLDAVDETSQPFDFEAFKALVTKRLKGSRVVFIHHPG